MILEAARKELSSTGIRNPDGFDLRTTPSGTMELKMWGRFPPGWAGNLSGGLSHKGISIIRGDAKKIQNIWHAVFEMDTSRCICRPDSIDFVALARQELYAAPAHQISLRNFSIGNPERHNGALYLEVGADDQLGFLAALLNQLAFLFLFPEEMSIETVNSKALDRFRLKGVGGNPPSMTAQEALQRRLQDMVAK